MGLGVIIQNASGEAIAAISKWSPSTREVATEEAMADIEGSRLARELGYRNVILKGEPQVVINFVQGPAASRSL